MKKIIFNEVSLKIKDIAFKKNYHKLRLINIMF